MKGRPRRNAEAAGSLLARPNEGEAFVRFDQAAENGGCEAGIIELDREVSVAFFACARPGSADFRLA